jgi:sRNA-binding protein
MMGGTVRKVTGEDKKKAAKQEAAAAAAEAEQQKRKLRKERNEAARIAGERQGAARRARSGTRGLLSDTRLNPEQGVATLGQTGL